MFFFFRVTLKTFFEERIFENAFSKAVILREYFLKRNFKNVFLRKQFWEFILWEAVLGMYFWGSNVFFYGIKESNEE